MLGHVRETDIEDACQAYCLGGPEQHVAALEVAKGLALCNFYWAVWSLMMENDHSDFGYTDHAAQRLQLLELYYDPLRRQRLQN